MTQAVLRSWLDIDLTAGGGEPLSCLLCLVFFLSPSPSPLPAELHL